MKLRTQKSKDVLALIGDQNNLTEIPQSHSLLLLMLVIRFILNLCDMQPNVHSQTGHVSEALVVSRLRYAPPSENILLAAC